MKKKFDFLPLILTGTFLFTLASCGSSNNDDDDAGSATTTTEEQAPTDDQGTYRAVLTPLNTNVAGNTSGTIEVVIQGEDVRVQSNVIGSPAGVKHMQNIMLGSACPDQTADVNGDGFVDINETLPSNGPILVPLDSDLSAQLDGIDFGPIANDSGSYVYRRSTSLTEMMTDLTLPDPEPNDIIVKLSPGQLLNLPQRVVVIHGVSESENLPDTVTTIGTYSAEQLLPIACGRLVRIADESGGNTTGSTTGTLP